MTGFVVAVGPGADAITLDRLHASRAPDALDARDVFREAGLVLFTTEDLPTRLEDDAFLVGDVLASSSSSLFQTLDEQRRVGLDAVFKERAVQGRVADDFALEHHFVLWRRATRELLAARDSLGVRPIFYVWDGETLIVASAVRWLLAAGVVETPDEESVGRFISGEGLDVDRTFIAGVRRLPPAHQLTLNSDGVTVSSSDSALRVPKRHTSSGSAQAFRARFEVALRSRLASPRETFCLLSGGLDSSALSVLGAELARRSGLSAPATLSAVFDDTPQWNERTYIEDVVGHADLTACMIDLGEETPFRDFSARLDDHGGLFQAPGLYVGRALYERARDAGRPVVIDGHGGDEVVSYGSDRFHELASERRWKELFRELRAGEAKDEDPAERIWMLYWLKYGPAHRWVSLVVRLWRGLARRMGRRPSSTGGGLAASSRERHSRDRIRPPITDPGSEAVPFGLRHHWVTVNDPGQSAAMETLHAAASALRVQLRFPFWDRALVEFCLAAPAGDKHRDGYTRWLLREAVPELPSVVRWRRDKLDFTPHLALGMLRTHEAYLQQLISRGRDDPFWRYVDRRAASELVKRLRLRRERAGGREIQAVWRLGALALWLDALSTRGHIPAAAASAR